MAKIKVIWSENAKIDLLDILEYYYISNSNFNYSLKLNDSIASHINLLEKHPLLGRPTKDKNVRALIAGNYEILYEYTNNIILIIMIWNCRRNPDNKTIGKR